jgi:hypothetical protein
LIRRSSTTASRATVRRRLRGEKLLQNNTDTSNPSNPPTIRKTPTVSRLNPEPVSTSRAKVRIAPITKRKMQNPIRRAGRRGYRGRRQELCVD